MNKEQTKPRSLREIENEVMAEGREWTRRRLQERLQEEAIRHGGVFPPTAEKPSSIGVPGRCKCGPRRGSLN